MLGQLMSTARILGLGVDGAGSNDPLLLLRQMRVLEEARSQTWWSTPPTAMLKIEDADTLAVSAGGAARIMQAAMETGTWAVAGWPVVEGPAECRMAGR